MATEQEGKRVWRILVMLDIRNLKRQKKWKSYLNAIQQSVVKLLRSCDPTSLWAFKLFDSSRSLYHSRLLIELQADSQVSPEHYQAFAYQDVLSCATAINIIDFVFVSMPGNPSRWITTSPTYHWALVSSRLPNSRSFSDASCAILQFFINMFLASFVRIP